MKVLVISDTHNATQPIHEVLCREHDAQVCIHLGDGVDKLFPLQSKYKSMDFYCVYGNCDHYSGNDCAQELLLSLEGHTLFFTHGDCFHVKLGLALLWEHARKKHANIALFGHTHRPLYELVNGIHLFNPGSLGKPPIGMKASYGVLLLEENTMPKFDIITL